MHTILVFKQRKEELKTSVSSVLGIYTLEMGRLLILF